jgi:hypothetical protein
MMEARGRAGRLRALWLVLYILCYVIKPNLSRLSHWKRIISTPMGVYR